MRIQQIIGGALSIQQGALYPSLYRLERQGLLQTKWGTSSNNRRAKYYSNRGGIEGDAGGGMTWSPHSYAH